jgi:putative transposase
MERPIAVARGRRVASLAGVHWFNTARLLEPIGYVPPAEHEARYYAQAAVA